MILAFDTYYYDTKARTVCLGFEDWGNSQALSIYSEVLTGVEEYVSGEFYKRELPCILNLSSQIDLSSVRFIIIDGFVYLDDEERPGLGSYLFHSLDKKIPIIGVAKNNFASIQYNKRSVIRGKSNKPLYITSIGIDLDEATHLIKSMDGDFRIPTLLKELDRLTKVID